MHCFKFYVVIHLFVYSHDKYAMKLHKSMFVDVNNLFRIIANFDCLALKKSGTLSAYMYSDWQVPPCSFWSEVWNCCYHFVVYIHNSYAFFIWSAWIEYIMWTLMAGYVLPQTTHSSLIKHFWVNCIILVHEWSLN